jgi:TM2 domain-containing membrane protein YozV
MTYSPPPGPGYPGAPGSGGGYGGGYQGGPGVDPATGLPYSDKTKLIAGLLGILLGGFGVGRFYTGHTGMGVAQLLVTIFTCGIGSLWGLIDGILILVNGGFDAQGRPLNPN